MTILGIRPAFLAATGFRAKQFAKDFGVDYKIGPYFDAIGRDHAYVINPTNSKRFEPLFHQLEQTYSDDEAVMQRRERQRARLIGQILGFDDCLASTVGPTTYSINVFVESDDFRTRTEVYSWLCSAECIDRSVLSTLDLITAAKKHFKPCGLMIGFAVSYPYEV